jgi:peptidoglycan/xylan/chitin deacetylase (PgdA/CDA1 family)
MNVLAKTAARVMLHKMGGLAILRGVHRRKFGILNFHSFSEQDQANVEAICAHIVRHYEPVSLSPILDALDGLRSLPDNAITVTVDDGYRNFLLHGHPIFRRYHIPTTLYGVAGFHDGKLWLWPDQIEFGLQHTMRSSIRTSLGDGEPLEFSLRTPAEKAEAIFRLTESLKEVSNNRRVAFLAEFANLCGVDIPPDPPSGREAMSWDELRAVASEGVEIGCHTESHPILSRLPNRMELEREIRGAKEHFQERLGFDIRHFCYPNGRPIDIGEAAIRCVKEAGFASAVSCTYGLNSVEVDRFQMLRIPFGSSIGRHYGEELLAGLHM